MNFFRNTDLKKSWFERVVESETEDRPETQFFVKAFSTCKLRFGDLREDSTGGASALPGSRSPAWHCCCAPPI